MSSPTPPRHAADAGPGGTTRGDTASGEATLRADARRNRGRILAAAADVFAEHGASASTEEVARRAGVAVGTVFRHFPTKDDLLRAIMKELLLQLTDQVSELATAADPGDALLRLFTSLVEQAAARRTVVNLLAAAGSDVGVATAIGSLQDGIAALLNLAQQAGTVRQDVEVAEVVALMTSACQGALHGAWDSRLQHRVLAVIFDGLRPGAGSA